jgi:hypothetical protein
MVDVEVDDDDVDEVDGAVAEDSEAMESSGGNIRSVERSNAIGAVV